MRSDPVSVVATFACLWWRMFQAQNQHKWLPLVWLVDQLNAPKGCWCWWLFCIMSWACIMSWCILGGCWDWIAFCCCRRSCLFDFRSPVFCTRYFQDSKKLQHKHPSIISNHQTPPCHVRPVWIIWWLFGNARIALMVTKIGVKHGPPTSASAARSWWVHGALLEWRWYSWIRYISYCHTDSANMC